MRFTKLSVFCVVCILTLFATMNTSAKLLFHDDFEKDTINQEPNKWEIGFAGKTKALVVADPKDAGNKVLKTSNNPSDDSRHDLGGGADGGSIYVVGDANWGRLRR